jgi:acetylornithine deacetylase/succinyl-diaminopimelate desuccinylase-like protein
MLLGALEVLAARGQRYPADMLVVLVPDEESESFISGNATNRWSREARIVLVLEPGQSRGDGETLVAGRRGLTEWKLEVTGQAAHSGLAYWSGRSAVAAAADWCARAQALSNRGTGPTVNVGRLVGGGAEFVRDLAHYHDLVGTSRQLNVISDLALAEGEMRFLTEAEGQATLAQLEKLTTEIAQRHGVTAVFTKGMHVSPVDPHGPGAQLVKRTVELARFPSGSGGGPRRHLLPELHRRSGQNAGHRRTRSHRRRDAHPRRVPEPRLAWTAGDAAGRPAGVVMND